MINTMEVAPEELPGLDLFQNCRLCLAKEKVSVDIFSEGHEIRLLYYKIVSCLPVHVTQDDKLPRKICMQCNEKVDNFYQFWTLTAKSQKTLLDWVEKKDLLPPAKIKTENVPPGEVLFKQEVPDYSDEDNDNDNDRYEDDNSEEDLEPSTVVKVCEETEETAGGTTPGPSAGTKIKVTKGNEKHVKEKAIVCEYDLSLIRSVDQSSKLLGALDLDEMKCKSCGLVEESETALYIHTWECNKLHKIFKCSLCGKQFTLKNTLKKHLRNKHLKNELSCHVCARNFDTEYARKKHREVCKKRNRNKTEMSSEYSCKLCGLVEKSMNDFLNHMRNCEGQFYDCDICKERFTKKHAIRDHMYAHTNEKPYLCDVCQKTFSLKSRLHLHIRRVHILKIHTKSKMRFSCTTCHKEYRCKQSLRNHVLSHLETVAPYICQICGKQYASHGNMNRHIAVWHENKNSDQNKHRVQCEVCGKSYSQPRHLRRHFSITHGDGKLKCPICGKRLSEKKGYDIHMNTHSGIKPWCCEICGRGFSTKDYLKVHGRIHSGDSPHKCSLCPKTYKQKSALTGHYRLQHPEVRDPYATS